MDFYKINGYQKLYNSNFIINEINPEEIIKKEATDIYILYLMIYLILDSNL